MRSGWATGCKIFAWIILVAGVLAGIVLAAESRSFWPVLAGIGSSLGGFLLFGTLGHNAETLDSIASTLDSEDEQEDVDEGERQARLKELFEKGELSEEEYKKELFEDSDEDQPEEDSNNKWQGRLM